MNLEQFPLPWRVIYIEGNDEWGVYDAEGNFTGIHVATPTDEDGKGLETDYNAEEMAAAIVRAMRPFWQQLYEPNVMDGDVYPILSVSKEDLSMRGFDVSAVTDEQMHTIGADVADGMTEYGGSYWDLLEFHAERAGLRMFQDGHHVAATEDITKEMLRNCNNDVSSVEGDLSTVVIPEGTEGYLLGESDGDQGNFMVEWYTDGTITPYEQDDGEVYETSGWWMRIDE